MARKRSSGKSRAGPAPGIPALDLGERLSEGLAAPCLLVVGEEDFLRTEALAAIRATAEGSAQITEFDGDRATLAAVLDELRTLSVFGGQRIAIVRKAGGKPGFATEHGEALASWATGNPSATLVLEAPKLNKSTKGVKALYKAGTFVDCAAPNERGLLSFLRARAKHWGRPFARGADMALLERLGGQQVPLAQIDGEVRKLAGAGEGPISIDQVQALATTGSSEASFDLVDCVGRGDIPRALGKLQSMFRDGLVARGGERTRDPSAIAFMLLGLLRWDLGRLLRGRAMLDQRSSPRVITQTLKVFRQKEAFMRRVRRADRGTLGRKHALLRAADANLKSSGDPRGTLTDVVVRLAAAERG